MQTAHKAGDGTDRSRETGQVPTAILTPEEMDAADRLTIASGRHTGIELMRNAGSAVAAEILRNYADATRYDVLCGPGNNGGDGYVVARLLHEAGNSVWVWAVGAPGVSTDAGIAASECPVEAQPLERFKPRAGAVVVDALYGAGLTRPLDGEAAAAAKACREAGTTVISVDLPSGIAGVGGNPVGETFEARTTVTFFRVKPAHLLQPGKSACGRVVVADIGISEAVLADIAPNCFVNTPALWRRVLPFPDDDAHKYARGHVAVFSGGLASTGAARLSAMAAARIGAGAVTVYSPANAMAINAAHLTSVMLQRVDNTAEFQEVTGARAAGAFVFGPGYGLRRPITEMVHAVLEAKRGTLVLDADGLTAFRDAPEALFSASAKSALDLVLTPHEGEFGRLFPDLAADARLSKLERARSAAARAEAVVVYKGSDSVIAAPDGRAAINANGVPWLATAGSGDVLCGMIAGLCAQGMPVFEAACAAVWIHAETASGFGPGLIAEDLPGLVPAVWRRLMADRL